MRSKLRPPTYESNSDAGDLGPQEPPSSAKVHERATGKRSADLQRFVAVTIRLDRDGLALVVPKLGGS